MNFLNFFFIFKTGFLCSFGACPGTFSVDQADPELTEIDPPVSAFRVLGLKARATIARHMFSFGEVVLEVVWVSCSLCNKGLF